MTLAEKIESRLAVVAVIGLGYVGLPLLAAFHSAGFPVVGLDNDPAKIDALLRGENYLKHLGDDLVRRMLGGGRFRATADPAILAEADAIISCVPTPLGEHLEPDLSFVRASADAVARTLRKGQLVVLESSTYPGTTRDVMLPQLSAGGLRCGTDFFLAYSPEREDPGRKDYSTRTIPKLVGGVDPASGKIAVALYEKAVQKVIAVSSSEVAEAAKLLENIYRCVNIALVNEMKTILTALGIDIWETIDAAATKPFGFQPFYPGPGLGGHCIPIDPFYLAWKAREAGLPTRFIELAGQINRAMPDYVIRRLVTALNNRGHSLKGARVLVLGLAYKPDVDDVRESPSIELIEALVRLGAVVDYNDPHVPATHKMRRHDLRLRSVPLTPQSLAGYDAVVIATHHSAYDWKMIAEHSRLIVDTRGVMRSVASGDKIVQA
jgi:UDP-N-acetyl-D-glucosamine dehydrogenase